MERKRKETEGKKKMITSANMFFSRRFVKQNLPTLFALFFGNATQLFHLFPFHCVYTYLKDLSSIITIITISYRQKSLSIPIVLFLLLFFQMLSATKQVVNTFIYFWVAPLKLVLDGGWLKKKRRKKERKFSLSLLI